MRVFRVLVMSLVVVFLMSIVVPRPGAACSCTEVRKSRIVLPADGASDIPVDSVLRVFFVDFAPELVDRLATEYRLLDGRGDLVTLESEVVGTRLDLRPQDPLRPMSRYRLEQVFAYSPMGLRLSDTERWEAGLAPSAPELRGRWYPVVSFETGDSGSRPEQPAVALQADLTFSVDGICTWGPWLEAQFEAIDGVVGFDVVELQVEGQGTLVTQPAVDATRLFAGRRACDPTRVAIGYSPPLRAQVVVLDLAGREVGGTGWQEVAGPEAPIQRVPLDVSPEQRQAVERWSLLRIEDAASIDGSSQGHPSLSEAPRSCPFGFEAVPLTEPGGAKVNRRWATMSPLASDGTAGWMTLTNREGDVELLSIARDGSISSRLADYRGYPQNLSVARDALYVVTIESDEEGKEGRQGRERNQGDERGYEVKVAALDPMTGSARWSGGELGRLSESQVATGGGTVLASWEGYTFDEGDFLAWDLFDEESGQRVPLGVGPESLRGRRLDPRVSGPAKVAFVDDHFLIAWVVRGGIRLGPLVTMILYPDGTTGSIRETGVEAFYISDMTEAEGSIGLVAVTDGAIEWLLLDSEGSVEVGPVRVSAGVGGADNKEARSAWNGSAFGILWSSNPGIFAAAVDMAGNVSPSHRLDPGLPPSLELSRANGIVALDSDFYAAWNEGPEEVRFARLECRTAPAAGAPQQIEAVVERTIESTVLSQDADG